MIADATSPKRPFDMIIVYDLSRFSRKTLDLLQYIALLKKHGVKLQSLTEPHYGDAASDESWIHTSAGNESMLPKTAKKPATASLKHLKEATTREAPRPSDSKPKTWW